VNAGSSWVGPLLSKLSTGGEARKCNVLAHHRMWIQRAVVFLALLFLFSPDALRGGVANLLYDGLEQCPAGAPARWRKWLDGDPRHWLPDHCQLFGQYLVGLWQ